MSELQDIIATSSILLAETKDQTLCTCHGCEEWMNALDFVIARIENKIHD